MIVVAQQYYLLARHRQHSLSLHKNICDFEGSKMTTEDMRSKDSAKGDCH